MADKNAELLKRLLATFRVEADEHLQAMATGLLALEKSPAGAEAAGIVETVFREAHSLKGAARAVSLASVEALCQAVESVFAGLKGGRLAASLPLIDLLHQAVAGLGELVAGGPAAAQSLPPAAEALIGRLEQAAAGVQPDAAPIELPAVQAAAAVEAAPVAHAAAAGTVRIATDKLDAVMRQVEELLSPRLAAQQRALELRDIAATAAGWKKARRQIQPLLRQIERAAGRGSSVNGSGADGSGAARKALQRLLEHLDRENALIATVEDRLTRLRKSAARDQRMLAGMVDGLLQDVKEMQLLPCSALIEPLPRMAREMARGQGKEIELTVRGGEIELDRRMLDELRDPLIHLLRNAVDHGVELPALRAAAGKPAHGAVTLAVTQRDGGKIELLIADDGAGIDGDKVKAAAKRLGLLGAGEGDSLGEREWLALVFRSGVSTSPIITDVSGRGLGLAIVREKVERLGGTVSIESQAGAGTAFHIVLPLSLATFRGVLVRVGDGLYALPAAGVERVARVPVDGIRTVENRETVVLDGEVVSLADLAAALELPRAVATSGTHAAVAVLGQEAERVAFRVDEVLGEQEILIKSLGPQLARVRNVAGVSMLGSGQLVPVLNVADLLKSAAGRGAWALAPAMPEPAASGEPRAVLVVEDSITSRALLKNILEAAGYTVATAVDGMDAYTALKTAAFDLVVSDVEMPRMDGFDLTARIRADKQLAELPVVLVTALETREHRERGIDVGANAYIVKSSFDQSNLLETIRRLI